MIMNLLKHNMRQGIRFIGILLMAVFVHVMAGSPCRALTPAATSIAIPNLSISANGGAVTVSQPANPASVAVLAVSGVAWSATPADAIVATGQSVVYPFTFAHNGNIGILPAQDRFYISVSSAWLTGVYQDAGATIPASGTVDLPPNSGNTYTFYVKITAPAGAVGQTDSATVTVHNDYYETNTTNDPFGDPDSISHNVITAVPDNVAPVLALTNPVDNIELTIDSVAVSGATEPGVSGLYSVSPSGATGTLSIDAGGAFSQTIALDQGTSTITVQVWDAALNTTMDARIVAVDSIMPAADFSSPLSGASIQDTVAIVGSATDTHFTEYALRYGPAQPPRPGAPSLPQAPIRLVLAHWEPGTRRPFTATTLCA